QPRFVDAPRISDPLGQTGGTTGVVKIVAFGDSVVWGNGEKTNYKFVSLVAHSVADETGKQAEVVSFAHSGARLAKTDSDDLLPWNEDVPFGDLDAERPTIEEQVNCAAEENPDAELIL